MIKVFKVQVEGCSCEGVYLHRASGIAGLGGVLNEVREFISEHDLGQKLTITLEEMSKKEYKKISGNED